ncbi:MAG TPA: hypothetical protein DEP84_12665 [Chloroflexi bacterium]|nr:hypothetical protein [Chloroflexota bacterium]
MRSKWLFRGRLVIPLGLAAFLIALSWLGLAGRSQPVAASASSLTVCPTGCPYVTINDALSDSVAGDVILVLPGIYTETIQLKAGVKLYGTPVLTVLNGNGDGPVVRAEGNGILSDTIFSGFVVSGGAATQGAGIYIADGASPTLSGLIVRNNSGGNLTESKGAGMFVTGNSAPQLRLSTFFSNTAGSGAAIYADGAPVQLGGNAFEVNIAGLAGGAIVLSNTTAAVYSNTFVANIAGLSGGALYINGGSPTIDNNIIFGFNSAGGSGGGIAVDGGTALIKHNRVVSNTATQQGGGIAVSNGAAPTIHNNLITNNGNSGVGVNSRGAGISINGAAGLVRNNTIAYNAEGSGEGVWIEGSSATPTIVNNIIVSNTYGIRGPTKGGVYPTPEISANDVWSNPSGNMMGANIAGKEYADGNISEDPLFVTGLHGYYYLSQTESRYSKGVDAGLGAAADVGLDDRTTRTDGLPDSDAVDMGYHYRLPPPIATVISQFAGGVLTLTANTTITIDFPADVVTRPVTVTAGITTSHPISPGSEYLGPVFSIDAEDEEGNSVTGFSNPFSIIIHYDESDLEGIDENTLTLSYWDTASEAWEGILTTVDAEANTMTAELNHLTTFAAMGQVGRYRIYLPLLVR